MLNQKRVLHVECEGHLQNGGKPPKKFIFSIKKLTVITKLVSAFLKHFFPCNTFGGKFLDVFRSGLPDFS
jgi:hypothetical protein